jgi:hypothetical protein
VTVAIGNFHRQAGAYNETAIHLNEEAISLGSPTIRLSIVRAGT